MNSLFLNYEKNTHKRSSISNHVSMSSSIIVYRRGNCLFSALKDLLTRKVVSIVYRKHQRSISRQIHTTKKSLSFSTSGCWIVFARRTRRRSHSSVCWRCATRLCQLKKTVGTESNTCLILTCSCCYSCGRLHADYACPEAWLPPKFRIQMLSDSEVNVYKIISSALYKVDYVQTFECCSITRALMFIIRSIYR